RIHGRAPGAVAALARGRRRRRRAAEQPDELVTVEPAQPEDEERVAVELLAEEVVDRGDVLARVRPVGARARRAQVLLLGGEERQPGPAERLLDVRWHLAREQLRREASLAGQRGREPRPLRRRQRPRLQRDRVR